MPTKQSRSATTPTGEESMIPVSQPSGLRELAALTVTEADKRLEVVQRAQISSLAGADKTKEPQEKTPKRQSPTLATRPKKYALEMWVEIETCVGMYTTPEEDSYSVDFAIDALNHAYPGCTGVYLGVAGHMLAFYGKKTNPRAGLPHDQAVIDIPTWMGYFARWRVRCMSISEASEIVAGCKRLEKENWRQARLELQNWFSVMQVGSTLSATARPFQPQAAMLSFREDDGPQAYPSRSGWARSGPTSGLTPGSPARRASLGHPHSLDDDGMSTNASNQDRPLHRRHGSRGSQNNWSGSDSNDTHNSGRRRKKMDGFSSKIQIPKFGGKKGHPNDVVDAFRQWAHCITYYHDIYKDSYLMPLVVSSLKGDTSDVFNWTWSVTLGVLRTFLRSSRCSVSTIVALTPSGSRGTWLRTFARGPQRCHRFHDQGMYLRQ